MADPLPASSGDPDVVLAAIARAAALLASREVVPPGAPLDRQAIEGIVEDAIREAFQRFGVDLDDVKSVEDHRETLAHARRSRKRWDKVGASLVGVLTASAAGGTIAAIMKYLTAGGAK